MDFEKVVPPAMPLSPEEFERAYQDQLNNILRLFFTRLTVIANRNQDILAEYEARIIDLEARVTALEAFHP